MSGAAPLVTVCVPTIGRMEYLANTRASLATQTYSSYEVLVLDNASPPEGQRLLADWADGDSRVRVLRVEPRIPMFENFNRGFAAARGKYLSFCHDDDTVSEDFLARHVAFMEAHPTAGISGSNFDIIDEVGALLERRTPIARTELWSGRRYIQRLMSRGFNPLTMQSVFYRREAVGPSGIDLALPIHYGDFVFLMRIAQSWDVGVVAERLVQVRRHGAQASGQFTASEAFAMRSAVLGRYAEELKRAWPNDWALHAMLRATVGFGHRAGLLWGWAAAQDDEEANACASKLGPTLVDGAVGGMLRTIDRLVPTTSPARLRIAQTLARPSMRSRLRKSDGGTTA